MHLWGKGIQVCSNEGPNPFPRGGNDKIAKIHKWNFKKCSSAEPLGQFQPNLALSILWVKGIWFCSNEEPFNFHEVDNCFFYSLNQLYDNNIYLLIRTVFSG